MRRTLIEKLTRVARGTFVEEAVGRGQSQKRCGEAEEGEKGTNLVQMFGVLAMAFTSESVMARFSLGPLMEPEIQLRMTMAEA